MPGPSAHRGLGRGHWGRVTGDTGTRREFLGQQGWEEPPAQPLCPGLDTQNSQAVFSKASTADPSPLNPPGFTFAGCLEHQPQHPERAAKGSGTSQPIPHKHFWIWDKKTNPE